MNIKTTKDQTITGKEADTVAALAIVGTVAVIGSAAAGAYYGLNKLATKFVTGSWKNPNKY